MERTTGYSDDKQRKASRKAAIDEDKAKSSHPTLRVDYGLGGYSSVLIETLRRARVHAIKEQP